MNRPAHYHHSWLAALAVPLLLSAVVVSCAFRTFKLDDAFMFYRYALHFREGYGIAWNAGQGHTYGLTSLGWFFVVLLASFLPLKPLAILITGSVVSFVVALAVMTRIVTRFARSTALRAWPLALALVALPLLVQPYFDADIINGMETMLSLLANALVAGAALACMRSPSERGALLLGVAGYAAFFVRPENGLAAATLPILLFAIVPGFRLRHLALAELCLFAPIAIQIGIAYRYFGTPVPLPFYVKSLNGYKGFICITSSGVELSRFLFLSLPYFCFATWAALQRAERRLLLLFLLPVLLTCLYLVTVLQIMGDHARYYVPFLPFVILPCLLVFDSALLRPASASSRPPWSRVAATLLAGLVVIGGLGSVSRIWSANAARKVVLYQEPTRVHVREGRLVGRSMLDQYRIMGDALLRELPAGTTVAASEVGYIGASAPQVHIIDIVGLNDREIALHGFSMSSLLARQPDLIWLPPWGYTWIRRAIWTDPAFLADYDVYEGAFVYGVAIRKGTPRTKQIEAQFTSAWAKAYPGMPMGDFRVLSLRPS